MNLKQKSAEPFVRISKRGVAIPFWKAMLVRVIALAAALVICAVIIYAIVKLNPLKVYGAMFDGAFGTNKRSWVTIRDIMMLLLVAVGLAPAFSDAVLEHRRGRPDPLLGGIAAAACMIYLDNTCPAFRSSSSCLC